MVELRHYAMKIFAFMVFIIPVLANATAYTSVQNGNWSDNATWGGGGHPVSGDTATIAHTVTVDVNSVCGTSPNDNTTAAVSINTAKQLIVSTNATLTIKGNLQFGFTSGTVTMNPGSGIVFDASESGGTPIYRTIGVNVYNWTANGTALSHCSISAPPGYAYTLNANNWDSSLFTYCDFTRAGFVVWNAISGSFTFSHCTFNGCSEWAFQAGPNIVVSDCIWTNTLNTAFSGCARLTDSSTGTSRVFTRNSLDGCLRVAGACGWIIRSNYLGGAIVAADNAASWSDLRYNVIHQPPLANSDNGAIIHGLCERNYWLNDDTNGNPHFSAPLTPSIAATMSQNIFEAYTPDIADVGDCCLYVGNVLTFQSTGKNNIVVKDSYPGTDVSSGDLLTFYNSTSTNTAWYRNTANVDMGSAVQGGVRAMFDVAEAGDGTANQVVTLKSNLAWATSSTNGYLAKRLSGSVQGIFTAAGCDYNWRFGVLNGDNQRGYQGGSTNTLWQTGDAVASGVDVHQGSGDPQFYDSSRNLAKWCYARGYGTQTYTNAITVIQGDPSKIPDLISYVFEGFRPGNAACRTAAADGGCVGAANFYKASRNFGPLNSYRATLSAFGL